MNENTRLHAVSYNYPDFFFRPSTPLSGVQGAVNFVQKAMNHNLVGFLNVEDCVGGIASGKNLFPGEANQNFVNRDFDLSNSGKYLVLYKTYDLLGHSRSRVDCGLSKQEVLDNIANLKYKEGAACYPIEKLMSLDDVNREIAEHTSRPQIPFIGNEKRNSLDGFLAAFDFNYTIRENDSAYENNVRKNLIEDGLLDPADLNKPLLALDDLQTSELDDCRFPIDKNLAANIVARMDIYVQSVKDEFYDFVVDHDVDAEKLNFSTVVGIAKALGATPGDVSFPMAEVILHPETMQMPNFGPIKLEANLGISMEVTPEELNILKAGNEQSKSLLLDIIASDRCQIGGKTTFPRSQNSLDLVSDLNFTLSEHPLHEKAKPSLESMIGSAQVRSSFQNSFRDSPDKESER